MSAKRLCRHESEVQSDLHPGHWGKTLIDAGLSSVNGFLMGVSEYEREEYGQPGVHGVQEGFYVIQGEGFAKLGEEEFPIQSGSAFIAPAGVPHAIRKLPGAQPVKLVWAHGAVAPAGLQ